MTSSLRTLHLRRRGNVWWLKLPIPRSIQHHYPTASGKHATHVEESLRTGDIDAANRAKHAIVGRWMMEFHAKARQDAGKTPREMDDAALYRESLGTASNDDEAGDMKSFAAHRATEIEKRAGLPEAERWHKLATSTAPTLREAWSAWMAVCEHNAATKLKDEQAFRYLLEHLRVGDATPAEITNETARDYVRHVNTEAKSARGGPLAQATREARIGPLRLFWTRYLEHNEIVPNGVNPWRNHTMGGRRKPSDDQTDKKRPYTEAEIVALLNGPDLAEGERTSYPKRTLMEMYALCFYTGARIGEIGNRLLRDVEKIAGGYILHIRSRTKTDDSPRSVPILHPIPVAVIERRIGERTEPTAQVFEEFIPGGPMGSLAWYASKALGRYRDKVGLGTATDTHSTRRQLITNLVAKGHPLTLVQFYVGHKPEGMTAGVYATPTSAGLRKIAKAISYPPKIEKAFRAALGIK